MLKKKPVTGMKDILPEEMRIRNYVMNMIRETYKTFGFDAIETPCVEHLENLLSKQGGDNEKLIFKILKRGEKLKLETAKEEADVADGGLRYDLTVPLTRYYANNKAVLPSPFKALQMGNVWRADRPQRGRYRQFMQCDIDIFGEAGNLAEIELITAMTTLLGRLEFKNFSIRINDRRVLKAMAAYAGFEEESYDRVFITLDKMDKIGLEGVKAELIDNGFAPECVEKYLGLFEKAENNVNGIRFLMEELGDCLDLKVAEGLIEIIENVEEIKNADFRTVFDPTLVRGMSYYTGTIFEVAMDEFGGSVGGGGRYDKMVGRFTGEDVPACGFSIGFERIVMLLLEKGFTVPGESKSVAFLLDKKLNGEERLNALKQAMALRSEGQKILMVEAKKNKKFQKEQLTKEGYSEIKEIFPGR